LPYRRVTFRFLSMNIKAICTDIDGTLLNKDRQLSQKTISVLQRVGQHIPIILASSRMPSAMTHLQLELACIHQPLICYNGGFTIHYNGNTTPEIFNSQGIHADLCSQILKMAENTTIHTSIYHEDNWFAPRVDEWTEREERITKAKARITKVHEVLETLTNTSGAHKVMCMGPEEEIHQLENALIKELSDHIHIYRSRPTYLELAPRVVTKATGLALVLRKLFPAIDMKDVMAFGDNSNDIELLKAVGVGVAVGNAKPEVKSVAKHVTLNSVEDGVAVAIERYLE
jgi:Cof subfamily protein (haloacid dehalogenase superfamily)